MRSMPVCGIPCWRAVRGEEALESKWKESEESRQLQTMKVESMEEESHVCEKIDEANALEKRQYISGALRRSKSFTKYQVKLR